MKRPGALLAVTLLIIATASLVTAANPQPTARVFLHFNGPADPAVATLYGAQVLHTYTLLDDVIAIEVPVKALPGITKNPRIDHIEFDALAYATKPGNGKGKPGSGGDTSNQPPQTLPWGVDRIDADLSTATGSGVKVCIVDTGIDQDHPDLVANIVGGRNFVVNGRKAFPNKWDDDNGHGTHVAGTIAAADNTIGVVGVAPQARLLGAKVLNSQGSGYLSDVLAGIDWCSQQDAAIISMSLGTTVHVDALEQSVNAAYANGAVIIAAAGNDYGGPVNYPAAYSAAMAVAATDSSDNRASFSNIGPQVEISGPGVSIPSTWKGGGYATISGTSMATPHVSGVAALALQQNPVATPAEIRSLLTSTADDLGPLGWDSGFGHGIVDAELN